MAVKKAVVKKAVAKKAVVKKTPSKGKVKGGDKYACQACGLVVVVDEACGCVEACDIVCCGNQMKKKR